MEFDFETLYIPGEENNLADGLSRSEDLSEDLQVKVAVVNETDDVDNILILEAEKRGKKVPAEFERIPLIEKEHALGHFGVESIFRKLWERGFWWPKERRDIASIVKTCTECARYDISRVGYHPSKSVEADGIWDHIQIDLVGPIQESEEEFNYIFTIIDVLSGFTILRPLKTKSESEVTEALWSVFCEYGFPKIVQSDQGKEFLNKVLQGLLKVYGVEQRNITAYHPKADGLVERKNREIGRALKKYMEGSTQNWQSWLPLIQFSLNSKILERTGTAPFILMFNRVSNDFEDYSKIQIKHNLRAIEFLKKKSEEFKDVTLKTISEKSKNDKEKLRERLDGNMKIVEPLKIGTIVYALDATRSSKWDPVYEGPFTVVRQNTGGAYILKDLTGIELKRNFTIEMLKVIDSDPNSNISDHWEIEKIVDHKRENNEDYYLVKWKNFPETYNEYVNVKDFADTAIIKKFWKNKKRNLKRKERRTSSRK